MPIISDYTRYIDNVEKVVASGRIDGFKSHSNYNYVLEHCSPKFGEDYYKLLRSTHNLSDDQIAVYCKINDRIGGSALASIGTLPFPVSPTSVGYLRHASLTIDHMISLNLNDVNVVEIGCGYGGYLLALDYASKLRGIRIQSYTCIDLDAPLRLQELYLSRHNVSFDVSFVSASTYGQNVRKDNLFFVSIYCFSEISPDHQRGYMTHLIPRVSHGLIMWNHVDLFNFGKPLVSANPEVPLTGHYNRLVLF
jgi:hypothetical protein